MNCYTLFSVLVARNLTPAEREWLRAKQAGRENFWAGADEDDSDASYWASLEGVACEVTEAGELLVISDEFGSPDAAAGFIQEFLSAFRPAEGIIFEWAHTATKMRPGEFGGGAAVITAAEIRWLNVSGWVHVALRELAP